MASCWKISYQEITILTNRQSLLHIIVILKIMRAMSVCVCSNECAKTAIRRATQTTEDYRKIRPTSWAARFRLEMRCFQENEKKNYSNVPQRSGKQHSVWYANIAIRALLIRLLCANKHYLLIYLLTALQFWADVKYLRITQRGNSRLWKRFGLLPAILEIWFIIFLPLELQLST